MRAVRAVGCIAALCPPFARPAEVAQPAAGPTPRSHERPPAARPRGTSCDLDGPERRVACPGDASGSCPARLPSSHERPPTARPRGTSCDLGGPERRVARPGDASGSCPVRLPTSHNPPPGHRRGRTNGRSALAPAAHRATSTDASGTSCDIDTGPCGQHGPCGTAGRRDRGAHPGPSGRAARRRQASGSSGASAAGFGASSWVATTRGDSDMKRRTSRSTMMSAGRSGRVRYSPSRDVSRDSAT